jgi:hypothetical protein
VDWVIIEGSGMMVGCLAMVVDSRITLHAISSLWYSQWALDGGGLWKFFNLTMSWRGCTVMAPASA